MFRFIETIRFENRKAELLPLHEMRLNKTREKFFFTSNYISLEKINPPDDGLWKCRILYSDNIDLVEFHKYEIRKINSLKMVVDDNIDYSVKFENRKAIERLLALRGNCDDIIIVSRGFITDTSYANLLFFDGNIWYTPKTPLLAGVRREYLLAIGQIKELAIRPEDLGNFMLVMLINAMLPFDINRAFSIENIVKK